MSKIKFQLTDTQKIALSFFAIILAGTILLCLPVSSKSGNYTDFLSSLFTATSATCVTGLSVFDTYSHWTIFGQIVILILIQIGGLGFMSIITMISVFLKRKISTHERKILMQSAGDIRMSGIIALLKKIFKGTFLIEFVGAVFLSFRFCRDMGILKGIYAAVFHSVSAFCNAGFDILGQFGKSSVSYYYDDPLVIITLSALIIIGGLGFMVWDEVFAKKFEFKRYTLHSKIVLTASLVLLVVPFALFFLFEYSEAFKDFGIKEKILGAFFQAVTPRTAGFGAIEMGNLSDSGKILTVFLMLIGGSPGSTAGGMKTTTIAILLLSTVASAKKSENLEIFKRRISPSALHTACSIFVIYVSAVVVCSTVMCYFEPFDLISVVFEVVSAIGTVGLSVGITSQLTVLSKIILIILMFAGRVGGLSLILVFSERRSVSQLKRPIENILIG